jgi:DNA/RNA-binding domain of Phe-tRNA-synthetase-like protein
MKLVLYDDEGKIAKSWDWVEGQHPLDLIEEIEEAIKNAEE